MKKLFLLVPFFFGFFGLNGMTVGQEPKEAGHKRRLSDEAQVILVAVNEIEALREGATTPDLSQTLAYMVIAQVKLAEQFEALQAEQDKRSNRRAAASVYVPWPGYRGTLGNSGEKSPFPPRSHSFSDCRYH